MSSDCSVDQKAPCLSAQILANSLYLPGFQGQRRLTVVGMRIRASGEETPVSSPGAGPAFSALRSRQGTGRLGLSHS